MSLSASEAATLLRECPAKSFVKLSGGYLNMDHVVTAMLKLPEMKDVYVFTVGNDSVDLILTDPADIAIVTKALDARCQD